MAQGGLERGIVDFQGSSGNMTFRVAQALGCDPIIIVGQDLAFGPEGQSHVPGTAHGFRGARYENIEIIEVPGNTQETVRSVPHWIGFLRTFEVDIARSEGLVINATEGGARMRGAAIKTFGQAIEDHIPPSTRSAVRSELEGLCQPATPQETLSTARVVRAHFDATRRAMAEVSKLCGQGADRAHRLCVELQPPAAVPSSFVDLPPDVEQVRRLTPLRALQELRLSVLGLPIFQEFVMQTASPVLMRWEVDSYALQRTCSDGGELLRALIPRYAEWFEVTAKLTQMGLDLLPWGEHALHDAFPELPPPTGPTPSRTMLEIMG